MSLYYPMGLQGHPRVRRSPKLKQKRRLGHRASSSPSPSPRSRSPSPVGRRVRWRPSVQGQLIGQGKQAKVYRMGQRARKQYKDYNPYNAQQRRDFEDNVNFLGNNSRAPTLYDYDFEQGSIDMRYLRDYAPLDKYKREREWLQLNLEPLLHELYAAHFDLEPAGIEWSDVTNLKNIAVRLKPLHVMFYEGGRAQSTSLQPEARAQNFLQQVLRELKLDRNPRAQSIFDAITGAGARD